MLLVTMITAGFSGLIFLALTWGVVARRVSAKILLGDGGDVQLEQRIRAHANFTEHVPLILILMAVVELSAGHGSPWLWGAGGLLVLARIAHAIGMIRPSPNPFRAFGALASWLLILALSLWALWLGFAPSPGSTDFV
jgi:uncharacterized membrane protein YecN with MAPEG domain